MTDTAMDTNPNRNSHTTRRWSQIEDATRRNVADAIVIVDSTELLETFEELLANRDPITGKPVGRPRRLRVRALCVALLCLALESKEMTIENLTQWFNTLPDDLLARLELTRPRGYDHVVNADSVGHLWNRLVELMNPSPTIEGKRVPIGEGDPVLEFRSKPLDRKARSSEVELGAMKEPKTARKISTRGQSRPLSDDKVAICRRRLDQLGDALLRATLPTTWPIETVAIDWTDHESHAKNPTKARTSADPDARYGRRHRKNPLRFTAATKRGKAADGGDQLEPEKNEPFHGYNVHFLVNSGASGLPEIALSMRVTPADDMLTAQIAVAMVDSLLATGQVVTGDKSALNVVVDRGYSMRSSGVLHEGLAARGVYLTFDFAADNYGPHGSHKGAVLYGGRPHCPAMPEGVEYPKVLGPSATPHDWRDYWKLWDAADQYAFRTLGVVGPDLKARFQCPAVAGKVRCPLYKRSLSIPLDKGIPEIYGPPAETLRACGTSFSADVKVGLGLRQRHPHGSREWTRAYDERTSVERFNSAFKALSRVSSHDIKVLGLAKRTVMMTFATVAVNVHRLRAWDDAHGEPSGVLGPRREWDPWWDAASDDETSDDAASDDEKSDDAAA